MKTLELLQTLCGAEGISGDEGAAAKAAQGLLAHLGECSVNPLGSVICTTHRGNNGKHILLEAHLDEIGMIVTYIDDDGFLKVSNCGGIDRRLLMSTQVTIYGKHPVKGVICSIPPHLQTGESNTVNKIDEFSIDIGMSKEQAEAVISLGDRVHPDAPLEELQGGLVTGRALDNRAGCAAVILAAQMLKEEQLGCSVSVLLASMEEIGSQGARTAAYAIDPTHAVVVDVSFGDAPGIQKHQCAKLRKGPILGTAPVASNEMFHQMIQTAKDNSIPYQFEIVGGSTGTDADAIAVTRRGVKTTLLFIPQRNMHTPVEIVALQDVEDTARLIAAYVKEVCSK